MALKTARPAKNTRKVPLSRGNTRQVRNVRKIPAREKQPFSFPWEGVKQFFITTFSIAGALAIVAGVSAGLFYGYNSLMKGEYFALKTLEIQGNSRISSREILEAADLTEGGNTLALSIDKVEEALKHHPWVKSVSVQRVLPSTLLIGVEEKIPAFWMLHEGKLHYTDGNGKIIAPVEPGKFASLPALEVEAGAEEALGALPDLIKSLNESRLPVNMSSVSLVRLSAARGLEVFIDESNLKLSIGLEEWVPNLKRLCLTLTDLVRRSEIKDIQEIKAQGSNVWVQTRTHFADHVQG
ncbi:FtsQ-type POTRA domain-containing protein [Desulfovibrio sp. OttesenSCG-928-G15]|nr:FtsQ-type POTRA domain-containing protein [Desulfovibrio sp. OttesenSCG-928-G15]